MSEEAVEDRLEFLGELGEAREFFRGTPAYPAIDESFVCELIELRRSMGLIFGDCWKQPVKVTDCGLCTLADGGRR